MKNNMKKSNFGKLKIFSVALSALLTLQTACIPTYAIYNKLMRKLENSADLTVADIRKFIEKDPTCVNAINDDRSVLDYALYSGKNSIRNRTEIAKYLITHGAKIRDLNVYTWACQHRQFGFVKWMLEDHFNFYARGNYNVTVAHVAAQLGRVNDLRIIMEKSPGLLTCVARSTRDCDYNTHSSFGSCTPLTYAIIYDQLEAVKFLLDKGSPISDRDRHEAKSSISDIENLIATKMASDPEFKDKARSVDKETGDTPLHDAIRHFRITEVDAYIKARANLNAQNKKGQTPLHIAAEKGLDDTSLLKLIAQRSTIRLNVQDNDGNTPLHIRILKCIHFRGEDEYIETTTRLIKAGANPNIRNKKGMTPLAIAIVKGRHIKVINALLDNGADPTISVTRDGDKEPLTLLDLCSIFGAPEEVKDILKARGIVHNYSAFHLKRIALKCHVLGEEGL